jgi:hypothetical protein
MHAGEIKKKSSKPKQTKRMLTLHAKQKTTKQTQTPPTPAMLTCTCIHCEKGLIQNYKTCQCKSRLQHRLVTNNAIMHAGENKN